MIDIEPNPYASVRRQLEAGGVQLPPEILNQLLQESLVVPEQVRVPSIQLSYDEIPEAELDEILGYQAISKAFAPIGLPFELTPVRHSSFLVFPLRGLSGDLERVAPQTVSEVLRLGSMDAFIVQREEISAREYLVGGLIECVRFCERFRHGLVIRW
jgi:hypothetical protein